MLAMIDDSVIQRILRHSNVAVTQTYYIKTASEEVPNAMEKVAADFDAKTAVQNLRDSDRTVNLGSGARPESVNYCEKMRLRHSGPVAQLDRAAVS